jgi:hypothetical protein
MWANFFLRKRLHRSHKMFSRPGLSKTPLRGLRPGLPHGNVTCRRQGCLVCMTQRPLAGPPIKFFPDQPTSRFADQPQPLYRSTDSPLFLLQLPQNSVS